MAEKKPEIMGGYDSHETIRRVLSTRTPCKVLDAATGQGVLANYLRELGWEVHCADIDPDNFPLEGVPFSQVDLNRRLPFEDSSFDAVVLVNAIHRLFNPRGVIHEFFRILRPGGQLYINANNYASVDLRLRFLLYGSIEHRPPLEGLDCAPEAGVRINIMYPQIADYLEAAGFRIVDLQPAAVRRQHRLLAPLAWLIRLLAHCIPGERRRRNHIAATSSGAVLLGGYYLLVEAIKPADSGGTDLP
jgi:SAM-dependent methyltransferase